MCRFYTRSHFSSKHSHVTETSVKDAIIWKALCFTWSFIFVYKQIEAINVTQTSAAWRSNINEWFRDVWLMSKLSKNGQIDTLAKFMCHQHWVNLLTDLLSNCYTNTRTVNRRRRAQKNPHTIIRRVPQTACVRTLQYSTLLLPPSQAMTGSVWVWSRLQKKLVSAGLISHHNVILYIMI